MPLIRKEKMSDSGDTPILSPELSGNANKTKKIVENSLGNHVPGCKNDSPSAGSTGPAMIKGRSLKVAPINEDQNSEKGMK